MTKVMRVLLAAAAVSVVSYPAFAADLSPAPVEPAAPAPVVLPFSWTGFYAGVNLGADFGDSKFKDRSFGNGAWNAAGDSFKPDRTGFTGGGQVGYNYQWDWVVLGAEADVGYLGGSAHKASSLNGNTVGSIDDGWYSTIRGRVGVAYDRFLVFGTGGVIFADQGAHVVDNTTGASLVTNKTDVQTGWTVGGGVEYALTDNWTVRGDFLYYDLGKKNVTGQLNGSSGTYGFSVNNTGELARLAVNYKF
ncbi:outer membrane protein [Labrys wisconsinensis]|uniref:Outer membrane immunogenic protein n=1 Tax=Labrys wisconsinensis TaxID=425677 RepID=A0ABU0JLB9_9HYPH|nr:outer membrane beta-barrel protein [Labrys wisconsinensis]MDQ0475084.1 outer membrane immunogenic protein [Labrys wisconsinensis]